jgi:hypothetical protein
MASTDDEAIEDRLISTSKIEGTAVYNRNGERLGEIHHLMIGRRSGQVAYAVMSFGSLLGLGGRLHPLPWTALSFDPARGGYLVDVDREQLVSAPHHSSTEMPFDDPDYGRRLRDYWPTRPSA